ncbi:cell division control protein 3 [Cordyceps militaris CM01]|uniref:Cell division control protein 3 n=2 Tax=Cordyceps militaris TaxID=73501 RepID=G3J895_CORMM|nr:cell division control protein 3 [Cordyceps militaris CM01]ATY60982.1 cell division control 3 [Cordyceps militaris]EGX94734.1 cell division control protein 3 [Cordyceps militaris CM01]
MPFDFVQQVRHRTRSVQLDQKSLSAAKIDLGSPAIQQPEAKRFSSLSVPSKCPSSNPATPSPNAAQPYRSMLDVDEPPKLPWNSMALDDLYTGSMDSTKFDSDGASSDRTEVATPPLIPHKASDQISTNGSASPPTMAPASPANGKLDIPADFAKGDNPSNPASVDVSISAPAQDTRNIVRRKLTGYVGFANLPNQWHRKSVRKGFNFNVMVVGESGLGKSTLVNTLFNTSLYPPKERKGPSLDIIPKTVTIQSISADIEEAGVRLRLTVVDTPGFGDFVNNDESWRPITDNIDQRYDAYLDAENKVNRMNIVDNRIHACVFFIQPTGHSLKPLDIEVMRRLHTKVNLIPVIAKSDTLTDEEIASFKARILSDIKHHGIQIFEGPRYELDDEETIAENNEIMSKVPFAVVGATNEIKTPDGRAVRGRHYPWGTIEVDNEEHCDFVKLRQMLIRTHMEELKEHTNNTLYENYRTDKLIAMGVSQDPSVFKEVNPAVKQEEERALHEQKLAKMEAEMKMVFQQKVQEKESKLKQSEEELYARHREMKEQLDRQRAELEDKKQRVESGRPLEKEGKRKGFSLR